MEADKMARRIRGAFYDHIETMKDSIDLANFQPTDTQIADFVEKLIVKEFSEDPESSQFTKSPYGKTLIRNSVRNKLEKNPTIIKLIREALSELV